MRINWRSSCACSTRPQSFSVSDALGGGGFSGGGGGFSGGGGFCGGFGIGPGASLAEGALRLSLGGLAGDSAGRFLGGTS